MSRVSIETTQNVQIDFVPASIGDRIVAFLIDFLILLSYSIVVSLLIDYYGKELAELHLYWAASIIFVYIPLFCYTLLSEVLMNGQTIGKRQRKIKVLCLDGTEPTLTNYLIRWVLRLVDVYMSFGAAAIVTIASNGRGQRLADLAAATTVVKVKHKISLDDLRRIFLTPVNENYQPVYEQAIMLSDNDINIIKDIMARRNKIRDHKIFDSLANKIKETLNITYEGAPLPFLNTILKDYNHLANLED